MSFGINLNTQQQQLLVKGLRYISLSLQKAIDSGEQLGLDCTPVVKEKAEIDQLLQHSEGGLASGRSRFQEQTGLKTLIQVRAALEMSARLLELEARDPAKQVLPLALRQQLAEPIDEIRRFAATMLFPNDGQSSEEYLREWGLSSR